MPTADDKEGYVTTKGTKREKPETEKTREINFKCKLCGQSKPFSEMVVLNRFFPPLVACRDCEKSTEVEVPKRDEIIDD